MFSGLESIESRELTANPSWASVANRLYVKAFINKLKIPKNCLRRSSLLTKFIKGSNTFKAIFRGFAEIYYRKATEQYTFL